MTKFTTLATAAALSLSVMAPAAFAMNSELNALTGAVYNGLNSMQMDLASINSLSLSDIQRIDQIMTSGDSESDKRQKINLILRNAGDN